MRYSENINTLHYLNNFLQIKFDKFLNPGKCPTKRENWKSDFSKAFSEFLITGINMPMDMKLHFCAFLMLYPMKQNEEKTFFRLDDNQRVAYISKFMIKKSRTCKVPDAVLRRYHTAKRTYDRMNNFASETSSNVYKSDLNKLTYMILEICFDNNTRSGRLDALLDD